MVLALPLLALGGVGLVLSARRDGGPGWWRTLVRPGAVSGVLGSLLWLPPLIDVATGPPRNLGKEIDYFRTTDEAPHSVLDGLRVIGGQFGIRPEWAMTRVAPAPGGQSPYLTDPIVPWTLLVVVAAAVLLWRRGETGRHLVVVAVATAAIGVLAVARTVGPAFQYRLLWTYIPAVVALVVVALAAWGWSGPAGRRCDRAWQPSPWWSSWW